LNEVLGRVGHKLANENASRKTKSRLKCFQNAVRDSHKWMLKTVSSKWWGRQWHTRIT